MMISKAILLSGPVCVLLALCWNVAAHAAEPEETKRPEKEMANVAVQEFDKVDVQQYPWGWIRWLMNAEIDPQAEMTFGMVYIKPHQENPAHLHPNCNEILHVLDGSCEHLVGKEWVTLKKGDTLRVPKNVPHRARTRDQSCLAVITYNTGERQFVPVDEGAEN
jgi:quercetin dioxygenase-like cupin family protein